MIMTYLESTTKAHNSYWILHKTLKWPQPPTLAVAEHREGQTW